MKWFRNRRALWAGAVLLAVSAAGGAVLRPDALGLAAAFSSTLSGWLRNAVAGSPVESALYRAMQLPGGAFFFRRSPREVRPALTELIAKNQAEGSLWQLRALEDEQALDFSAAERDWKTWTEKAPDKAAAELELADFYERRLRPKEELAVLEELGRAPLGNDERLVLPQDQSAWKAWERMLRVAEQYDLPKDVTERAYRGWEERYPRERAVYEREFGWLLSVREYSNAKQLIKRYQGAFPKDEIAPVQYEAQLAARQGSAQDGLAVYDRSFKPLWPAELVHAWYQLLVQGRKVRGVSDELRAKIDANASDLADVARLFYIEQQQGQGAAAEALLENFRKRRDASGGKWSDEDLYTLARLEETAGDMPEAARYYYALAANHAGGKEQQEGRLEGLAGLARLLLSSPQQALRMGAANLALYRDIATMDRGPGYLNGILSLLLNASTPDQEFAQEEQLAVPYYHRAKAAEIVALIDKEYPNATERPALHARLIEAYQTYGDNAAVIKGGTEFLAQFPNSAERVKVALETADAYSRINQQDKEFAIYQSLLKELAARANGVPLGGESAARGARSQEYAQVLNRYLGDLVSMHRLPDALEVLRGELDRNPQDPGLYERLAQFFEQNQLNSHVEEVYQRAIQQFQSESWYAKLARFYLRERRDTDYRVLSHKVTDIFSGTELQQYLEQASAPNWQLAFEVNQYAHQRFPHNLVFVERLIGDYRRMGQPEQVEKLLWAHWSESPDLRNELFELLSRTGRLDGVLAQLKEQTPQIGAGQWPELASGNPAAEQFWVAACVWQSHFEQAVDAAGALSAAYPGDAEMGGEAASLYRSFAYFHPEDTEKAVAIENRLLSADPGNLDTMARVGDIYADRGRMADASPYWVRMGEARPGETNGYLQAATVFWDYFDFPHALQEINTARRRLNEPTLFGYQAGAIDESAGDAAGAAREYVASALSDEPSEQSKERLLTLASRPALRSVIEGATADLMQGAAPAQAAVSLRVAILDAENRRDAMGQELKALAARTESFDVLASIAAAAREHSLPDVEEASLRRQIALTLDPIHNLQVRYQLVDLLVRQKDTAQASAEVDAINREYPKILGVVRATVNYDWEHDRKPLAVTVLLDAAQVAYPKLQQDFQLEAASKLTELGEYARAKALLQTLLAAKPMDASVETAMAKNYARSGDQAGLVEFDRSELSAVTTSNLAPAEKQERTAELRRSMIAAATLLGNWSDAVDQYIELINAYPDDAGLTEEAALFAIAHDQRERLFAYYRKTIENSPRNPRWSIVLARLATTAQDFPAAIAAYEKAITLRPERQGLLIAQSELDARLQRFDDAVIDYQKLYKLSYSDPQWMQRVAEVRARQGREAEAVQALETAWINGRAAKAANYFQVAAQLESWKMLDAARKFAEHGVDLAGADLLVNGEDQSGAATYARVMARLRQADVAWTRLNAARQNAGELAMTAVAQQTARNGFASVTSEEWRRQRQQVRTQAATVGFAGALRAMGEVAATYYTPEEKMQFDTWLRGKSAAANDADVQQIYLPAAQAAELAQLEADLDWRLVEADPQHNRGNLKSWIALQERRVQLEGAGEKLEAIAARLSGPQKLSVLGDAAEVHRRNGEPVAELRVLEELANAQDLSGDQLTRFYRLLLAQRPQELVQRSSSDGAAQYLVTHGSAAQALEAIGERSKSLPPVWMKTYLSVTGFYRRQHTEEISQAFVSALDAGATIGERIDHPEDRDKQLAGSVWFYYGSRYGEYLDEEHNTEAEGYLESSLEAAPGDPQAYSDLAGYWAEARRPEQAIADYQLSLELKADQPAVLDRIADVSWKAGRKADATAAWRAAVALLAKEMNAEPVPQSFWGDAALVMRDCSADGQYAAISQPMDAMIRAYADRNGTYQAEPLLKAGYQANGERMDWLLKIVAGVPQERGILNMLRYSGGWIKKDQMSGLLGRIVELERAAAQEVPTGAGDQLTTDEAAWVSALLDEGKTDLARTVLAQVAENQRTLAAWLGPEIRLAEVDRTLPQLVAQWKKAGRSAPNAETLRNIAANLHQPAKNTVMEYVYQQALEARDFSAPNFLGLAAIRLDDGDTSEAVQLLHRMLLVSGDEYEDMDSAAALLEEHHHAAEAAEFLRPLSQATPWKAAYKVRLAKALLETAPQSADALRMLHAVAGDPNAGYDHRVAAVEALKGSGQAGAASANTELGLLAKGGCPTGEQVSQPMFVRTRVLAAACAQSDSAREPLLRAALAIAPDHDAVRLLYVWAGFGARDDVHALLAAEPFLETGQSSNYSRYSYRVSMAEDGQLSVPNDANGGAASGLAPQEAGRLYLLVIRALQRRRDFDRALGLARQSENQARNAPQQSELAAERKRLEAIVKLEKENAARAPSIHKQIEQDHVVRPQLAATGSGGQEVAQ